MAPNATLFPRMVPTGTRYVRRTRPQLFALHELDYGALLASKFLDYSDAEGFPASFLTCRDSRKAFDRGEIVEKTPGITGLGLARLARVLTRFVRAKALMVGARTALAHSAGNLPEEGPAVFQPEILLPSQYYEALHKRHLLEGEKLLMFAVLNDAVDGYMKFLKSSTKKGQNRFREAEEWINRRDKIWLYSFDNVCEALDINPDYMRRGLHQWKQAQLESTEHASTPEHSLD
jgi:hypothetical protein